MKRTGRQKDIVTPEKKQEQRELLRLFSANIRKILKNTDLLADDLQEIRLRTGAPLLVVAKDQEYFLTPDGALTGEWEKGYPVSPTDIRDTMDYIGSFSLYAYEDELRQGFLTVEGGHRIGIAGKTVIEGEKVKGISHISCINVRVAHEKKGCADRVMPYLWEDGRFLHTLIVSAPGCGKTTMLRDIIRQISDGESPYPGLTVGVVDERSEIAGCYLGVAQNDVGIRTDVLDCCPKAEGMMMLIRAMSPDVVAVDEIGTGEDIRAIESVVNCGCKLLATVHGNSMEDMKQKPLLNRLVESHVFERYIVLDAKPHAGIVQAYARCTDFQSQFIYVNDFSCMHFTKGTAFNGEVLSECEYESSINSAVTCYNAFTREIFLFLAEVVAARFNKRIDFYESAFIKQKSKSFTSSQLAFCMLFFNTFFATHSLYMSEVFMEKFNSFFNSCHSYTSKNIRVPRQGDDLPEGRSYAIVQIIS